eukprot:707229-Heterocapsa_arctica.AAC.1
MGVLGHRELWKLTSIHQNVAALAAAGFLHDCGFGPTGVTDAGATCADLGGLCWRRALQVAGPAAIIAPANP